MNVLEKLEELYTNVPNSDGELKLRILQTLTDTQNQTASTVEASQRPIDIERDIGQIIAIQAGEHLLCMNAEEAEIPATIKGKHYRVGIKLNEQPDEKTKEIQELGKMLTATTIKDKKRLESIIASLCVVIDNKL